MRSAGADPHGFRPMKKRPAAPSTGTVGGGRAERLRTISLALFLALVVIPLLTIGVSAVPQFRTGGPVLEIEMRATAGQSARLFSAVEGEGWVEVERVALARPADGFERVRFILPRHPIELLRYHPIDAPGTVIIRHMRVTDSRNRTVRELDPGMMMPLGHVAEIGPDAEGTRVVTIPDGNDPMLLLRAAWLAPPPRWHNIRFVTPLSLAWISCAVMALMLAGIGTVAREASRHRFGLREGFWVAGLLLAVLAARLALLREFPSPVPFWDQWDAEAGFVYIPWANDALSWRHMFALHNEHRIFFTRLLALALLTVNGQWDPLLQMVVNAGLYSITAAALALVLWLCAGRRHLPLIVLITAMIFAPPFAWENTLAGFQSAFYFLVFFSVLAVWLMGFHPAGSFRWILGWLYAACALFTVAGGMLTAVAIATPVVLRTMAVPRLWRQSLVTLLALAAILAIGYSSASPPLPHHAELKAQTVHTFSAALARNLAFPWVVEPRASVLVWLPVLAMAAVLLFRRASPNSLERIVLALVVWTVLQAGALAYTRGVGGRAPAPRYLDTLGFVLVANSMALLALRRRQSTVGARQYASGLLMLYLVSGSAGIVWLIQGPHDGGAGARLQWMRQYSRNVREFLLTDDVERFVGKRAPEEVPYFSPAMLTNWLRHAYVRSILPAAIREPLRLEPRSVIPAPSAWALTVGDVGRVWDSYSHRGEAGQGRFESEAIACRASAWLRFEVAGSLNVPGLSLSLRELESHTQTPVRPGAWPRRGWIGASVPCPRGPFSVVAVDESPQSWFAFREPTEIGRLSVAAGWMIQKGLWLVVLTSAAVLLTAAWPWISGRLAAGSRDA